MSEEIDLPRDHASRTWNVSGSGSGIGVSGASGVRTEGDNSCIQLTSCCCGV